MVFIKGVHCNMQINQILKNLIALGFLLAVVGMTGGCAMTSRAVKGESPFNELLKINTQPTGAKVSLSNGQVTNTPAIFTIPRKTKGLHATIELDGYETIVLPVEKTMKMTGAIGQGLNLAAGIICPPAGGLGVLGDLGWSGAAFELKTNDFLFVMQPVSLNTKPVAVPSTVVTERSPSNSSGWNYPPLIAPGTK